MPAQAPSYLLPFAKVCFEGQYCYHAPRVDSRLTEKGGPTFLDEKASDLKGDHQLQPTIARHQYQQGRPYPISICAWLQMHELPRLNQWGNQLHYEY